MTYRNQYLFAGAVACALSLPVLAQEYRYPALMSRRPKPRSNNPPDSNPRPCR